MEYIYAALLLHKAGQKVDEGSIKKVIEASGAKYDDAQGKALVAALDGVDIEEAIKSQAVVAAAAPVAATSGGDAKADDKPAEAPKDDKKSEEEAAAGLGALFG